jgi:hypothetical protein
LLDIREWYQKGRVIRVISDQQTRFWHDSWLGGCPLKVTFPNLFKIVSYPDIDVCQAFRDGQWDIPLRRQLHGSISEEWTRLQDLLMNINLEAGRDRVDWALEQSKRFTTSSLYKFITTGGVRDQQMINVWKCNIPLKVKIFIWMAAHAIRGSVEEEEMVWPREVRCM